MNRSRSCRRLGLATPLVVLSLLTSVFLHTNTPAWGQDKTQPASPNAPGVAAATDPILVVTLASMNKLTADINYISGAVGQPQFGGLFGMMAGSFTQGLDTARPVAVLVPLINGTPQPIGLIPTTDVELMLKRLEGQTGPADKLDDGTLVVAAGNALIYVRQVGAWAVASNNRDALNFVPADPQTMLQGMGDNYDIGVRVNLGDMPLPLREMIAEQLQQQMKQGLEQALANQADVDEEAIAMSMKQVEQLKKTLLETDELMFGLNINPTKRMINVDTQWQAIEGTSLATQNNAQKSIPSAYSLVLNANSPVRYHSATSIPPATIEMFEQAVNTGMTGLSKTLDEQEQIPEDVKGEIEEMLQGLVNIAMKTMKEGKSDLGVVVVADDGVFRVAGGGFLYSGAAMAEWVQKLATKLQQIPDPPQFKFNESTYNGVAMHSITINIPADKTELISLLGPQAVIHLGTAQQAVYFGVGKDSTEMMKKLIDSAGADKGDLSERPLGQMRIRTLPLLRLAQSVKTNDMLTAMIDAVARSNEFDFINVTTKPIPNGQSSVIEIGEGLLSLVGAAIREGQKAQLQQLQQQGGQF